MTSSRVASRTHLEAANEPSDLGHSCLTSSGAVQLGANERRFNAGDCRKRGLGSWHSCPYRGDSGAGDCFTVSDSAHAPGRFPLRVLFVAHWKYLEAARAFQLHVPKGFGRLMFTHLASRTVYIDNDRYIWARTGWATGSLTNSGTWQATARGKRTQRKPPANTEGALRMHANRRTLRLRAYHGQPFRNRIRQELPKPTQNLTFRFPTPFEGTGASALDPLTAAANHPTLA